MRRITVTEDAYEVLIKVMLKGETFSDAIRRLARRGSLAECAGLWSDMPESEHRAIIRGIESLKEDSKRSLKKRLNEAGVSAQA